MVNLPELRDYSVRIFKSYSFKVAQISMLDMVILMLSFLCASDSIELLQNCTCVEGRLQEKFLLHIQLWTNEKVSSIGLYDFASGYA